MVDAEAVDDEVLGLALMGRRAGWLWNWRGHEALEGGGDGAVPEFALEGRGGPRGGAPWASLRLLDPGLVDEELGVLAEDAKEAIHMGEALGPEPLTYCWNSPTFPRMSASWIA